MKSLLIFSTLLVCALAYRVVPNMNHGSIKPDYLAKCVNASIVAIESYDMDGNNGLSYEEIKDIPDLAVTEDNFKTVWDMNKDGQLDLTELITNVYTFALVQ
eukprot:01277.XXX_4752_3828_1 [CDS] Oithona nana genome sequencing.